MDLIGGILLGGAIWGIESALGSGHHSSDDGGYGRGRSSGSSSESSSSSDKDDGDDWTPSSFYSTYAERTYREDCDPNYESAQRLQWAYEKFKRNLEFRNYYTEQEMRWIFERRLEEKRQAEEKRAATPSLRTTLWRMMTGFKLENDPRQGKQLMDRMYRSVGREDYWVFDPFSEECVGHLDSFKFKQAIENLKQWYNFQDYIYPKVRNDALMLFYRYRDCEFHYAKRCYERYQKEEKRNTSNAFSNISDLMTHYVIPHMKESKSPFVKKIGNFLSRSKRASSIISSAILSTALTIGFMNKIGNFLRRPKKVASTVPVVVLSAALTAGLSTQGQIKQNTMQLEPTATQVHMGIPKIEKRSTQEVSALPKTKTITTHENWVVQNAPMSALRQMYQRRRG